MVLENGNVYSIDEAIMMAEDGLIEGAGFDELEKNEYSDCYIYTSSRRLRKEKSDILLSQETVF